MGIEDWNELALYIAMTHKQEEINEAGLEDLVHKRRHATGRRPGITTIRAFSLPPKNREEDKRRKPKHYPSTEAEKKKMVVVAITTEVDAVMGNHCYSFDNIWRKQSDSIGNKLTGKIAKLVMAWWMTKFNSLTATTAQILS
mgnify:FL=1